MMIKDKYYPLYFDYDLLFGDAFQGQAMMDKLENAYYIKIHRSGELHGRKRLSNVL